MEETTKAPAVASAALRTALLAFARAPGLWQVQCREPALLFASVPSILAIAAQANAPDSELRAAALFFVRVGLLYPDADAHAIFGYAEAAEPVGLKERYRLLARLTHPDRAAAVGVQWPEGTAARINRACEVLSSPDLPIAKPVRMPVPVPRRAARPAPRSVRRAGGFPLGARASCALALAVAVAAGMLLDTPDGDHLVQAPERTVRMAVAAASELLDLSDAAPVQLHLTRRLGHADR